MDNNDLLKQQIDNQNKLIEELSKNNLHQHKRDKRLFIALLVKWGVIFLLVMSVSGMIMSLFSEEMDDAEVSRDHIAMLKINEVISDESEFANFEAFAKRLNRVYKREHLKAIIININSPGGSPAQSSLIYDFVMAKREEHKDVKVYAVIEDIGASGAYYIASSAEKIIANKFSIVGSIGVIMSRYGVDEALGKLHIHRKTQKAGKYKDILDPTKPDTSFELDFMQKQLDKMHSLFISDIKKARKNKLNFKAMPENMMFSGLFWTGVEAKNIGLIDELGDIYSVKAELGDLPIINDTPRPSILQELTHKVSMMFLPSEFSIK